MGHGAPVIALLTIMSCTTTPVEIDPDLDICRVVSSELGTPVTEVLDLLPSSIDATEAALVPIDSTSRWVTLRLELLVDEESPSYLLTREATGPTATCPAVIRTPMLGSVSLDDEVEVFVVAGWAETSSSSGQPQLESFRLGGEAQTYQQEDVQEAMVELASLSLIELRPEIDLSQAGQILAQIYVRGGPEDGELGIKTSYLESGGYDYNGPLLSGPWSRAPSR